MLKNSWKINLWYNISGYTVQNLRTHNTMKTELPKRKLVQKTLLSNTRPEAVETRAVTRLINKWLYKLVSFPYFQNYWIYNLNWLKMKEQPFKVNDLPPEDHSAGDGIKAKSGVMGQATPGSPREPWNITTHVMGYQSAFDEIPSPTHDSQRFYIDSLSFRAIRAKPRLATSTDQPRLYSLWY